MENKTKLTISAKDKPKNKPVKIAGTTYYPKTINGVQYIPMKGPNGEIIWAENATRHRKA